MLFMPGSLKTTRRAVVIIHPDFDKNGKAGIQEAKQFADQLIAAQRQLLKTAAESQPPDVVDAMRAHVGQLQVLVRNLPEDVI